MYKVESRQTDGEHELTALTVQASHAAAGSRPRPVSAGMHRVRVVQDGRGLEPSAHMLVGVQHQAACVQQRQQQQQQPPPQPALGPRFEPHGWT